MADELVLKCEDCNEEAYYLDLDGFNEAYPHCLACLGAELISLEIDKGRVIRIDEWDEWHENFPHVRLVT